MSEFTCLFSVSFTVWWWWWRCCSWHRKTDRKQPSIRIKVSLDFQSKSLWFFRVKVFCMLTFLGSRVGGAWDRIGRWLVRAQRDVVESWLVDADVRLMNMIFNRTTTEQVSFTETGEFYRNKLNLSNIWTKSDPWSPDTCGGGVSTCRWVQAGATVLICRRSCCHTWTDHWYTNKNNQSVHTADQSYSGFFKNWAKEKQKRRKCLSLSQFRVHSDSHVWKYSWNQQLG